MLVTSTAEVVQLTIGAILGVAVSLNLGRFGLSFRNPETRVKAAVITLTFLFTFLVISDLLLN